MKNKRRDKMGADGGRMDEERPRIRMQIDVIAHDATVHESHTKLHCKIRMEKNHQMNEKSSRQKSDTAMVGSFYRPIDTGIVITFSHSRNHLCSTRERSPLSTCFKMPGAANFKCAMHNDEQPFTVYDNSMNNNAESGAIIIAVSQRLFDRR